MPGSGKSYIQKILLKKLKKKYLLKNNFNLLNKLSKLYFILVFILNYPYFFIKTIHLIFFKIKNITNRNKHFYYFYNEILQPYTGAHHQ